MQGAFLDEHGAHGAAALVQLGLNNVAAGGLVGIGLEFHHLGLQGEKLEQFIETLVGLGGNLGADGVAAPFLGLQAELGELAHDAVGVGAGLVDLVDGHDDRHIGSAGVVDGLAGLLHDAVVGGHNQDDEVGDLGAAGAHGRESLVAGGVQEDDVAVLGLHMVGADVLGDAAGFAARHVRLADGVKQGGLAVVDMTHDGDHGRTRLEILGLVGFGLAEIVLFLEAGLLNLVVEFGGHDLGRVEINGLVDGGHDSEVEKHLDDFVGLEAHLMRHIGDADGLGDAQLALRRLQGLGHGRGRLGLAAFAVSLAPEAGSVMLLLMMPEIAGLEIRAAASLVALLLAAGVGGLFPAEVHAAHGTALAAAHGRRAEAAGGPASGGERRSAGGLPPPTAPGNGHSGR